jgi:prevent-host-death family protein
MNWNIAQAKQHFSEVVKQASTEPQIIYNRNTPVAALISAEEIAAYRAWKAAQTQPQTLGEAFAELRQLMIEAGYEDGLELPPRSSIGRPNAFVEMLEEEYPELQR